jgi:hypothetical protein
VGAAAARLALVVEMPPEVNGRAVHAVAAAQRNGAAAVGADSLRWGVGDGGDGLVGGGWWAVFIGCGSFARPYGISETAVLPKWILTGFDARFFQRLCLFTAEPKHDQVSTL